jgi:transcriptional regulator with XRE-family HTH domain
VPERNTALAVAVARDGRHKYRIAVEAGVSPSALGSYLTGRCSPKDTTRRRLAEVLGVDESDIFPQADRVAS